MGSRSGIPYKGNTSSLGPGEHQPYRGADICREAAGGPSFYTSLAELPVVLHISCRASRELVRFLSFCVVDMFERFCVVDMLERFCVRFMTRAEDPLQALQ